MSKTNYIDISGLEFDWFGVDKDLNIALFSTIGEGPVPKQIQNDMDSHSDFVADLPISFVGDMSRYSTKLGIYVYEWDKQINKYKLTSEPTIQCKVDVLKLPDSVYEISGLFSNNKILKVSDKV